MVGVVYLCKLMSLNVANEEAEDPVVEEPTPSKLAVMVTFITTLVSSIIPEQPQVI